MSRSVLLIEDNEQNRYLVTFLLEQHGYEVSAAVDGAAGIELAQRAVPDLVLLDIQLPKMDGYAVARALRMNPALAETPIVAVTSYAMPGDREKALAAGCTGYIEKPINPETFVAEVERALSRPEVEKTRVLVVDDNEENLYYLETLLTAHGCAVTSARHGAEALLKARGAPPDLVISDLLMPVMDGFTLLRHWKLDERLRSAPFIVYTATYTEPADEQLALNLGADAFILKPAEPADLLSRLRTVQANAAATVPEPSQRPIGDPQVLLHEYSDVLIRKLEHKTIQLEESNRSLLRDIAARERAESALRDGEERFRQLAENIEDVFWLSDARDASMYYVSPAYEAIWDRSPRLLLGDPLSWLNAVHPDDRERVGASLADYASGGWDATFRILRSDGEVRWLRSRSYPVRNAAGEVYRVAGVSRDITEYRRLEEQLRQAQKLEAVGRLAGGVAHDFNNLLSVILSYSSLIVDELRVGDPLRADVEEILEAGERARDLTRQLLAFSRQQVLQPKVLDLGGVVRGMENMIRRLLGADIVLTLLIDQPAGRVYADPSQVEQILMNLAVNARDAMPEGGQLTVEVSDVELGATYTASRPGVVPGPYVMLAVTDTGTGMDAATCEQVFEPFFTTKEVGKGTGLGLSTSFGIVKQSRGDIHVDTELGVGTTFEVYLPCTDRAVEPVAARPTEVGSLRGTEVVLLVEDDAQLREITSIILRKSGYEVLDAQNGGEAFLVSEKFAGTIDLLLTDVVMPRMSGHELAARLRPTRPGMKVLYVSGYTEDSIVNNGVLDAEISLLQKPITPDGLLRRVRAVLGAPAAR